MHDSYRPGTRGSALVLVEDGRAAFASVLVLQETGFGVDVSTRPDEALAWLRAARYDWVVCAAGERAARPDFLRLLRLSAPAASILVIGATASPALAAIGIEAIQPPVDVNRLMERFAREAA